MTAWQYAVSVLYFTPLPGCFSPFPRGTVRYRSTRVFSLGGWSPLLPTGNLVSRGTRALAHAAVPGFGYGALTPCGGPFQALRLPHRQSGAIRGSRSQPAAQPHVHNACRLTWTWFR